LLIAFHGTEPEQFQFPEEGSYLREVESGQPTLLMNEAGNEAGDSNDVPVRILKNFFVFNPRALQLVSLPYLWEGDGLCEAFGWAVAETDEDEQDDREFLQNDGIWFRTSTILTYSLDVHQEYGLFSSAFIDG
jgi:hypothetical protein